MRHRHGGLPQRQERHAVRDEHELARWGLGRPHENGIASLADGLGNEEGGIHGGDGRPIERRQEVACFQERLESTRTGYPPDPVRRASLGCRGKREDFRRLYEHVPSHPRRSRELRETEHHRRDLEGEGHRLGDRRQGRDAIDRSHGRRQEMGRKLKKELGERWKTVDKAAHDNAFILAAGALGVGVLIGYLIARSDD
jgi:hypothetical protein